MGGPEAVVAATLSRIAPDGALGVAVSGGGDSTALLVLAADWARHRGRALQAVTVDHALRPESAAEARAVGALCGDLGLPHTVLRWEGALGGNLQSRAREARQALIGDWTTGRGLAGVLLGHTLDDQAETVLLRLARGSGLDGLSAMAERAEIAGTLWLRPLLGVRRTDLRQLLRARGIGWVEDPSNDDMRFERVRIRRALAMLAPLGVTAQRLAETAARLAEDRAALAAATAALARTARVWGQLGEASLCVANLRAAPPTVASRLLADTLRRIGAAGHPPRRGPLDALWLRAQENDFAGATLGGCRVWRAAEALVIAREAAAQAPAFPAEDGAVWDGRWRLRLGPGRSPVPAHVGALGADGLAALRAVGWERSGAPVHWLAAPAALRVTVPAFFVGDRPVAVPHAGYLAESMRARGCSIAFDDLSRP